MNLQNTNINIKTKPELATCKLLSELSHFGLCPFDWTIDEKKDNELLIKNIDDDQFRFLGKLKPNKSSWHSIKLISI